MLRTCLCVVLLLLIGARSASAEKHIYAADHNTGKVVKFKEDGTPLWEFPNRSAHDVQVLANGNILINPRSVQEVTPEKEIVWEVGPPLVMHAEACQRLPNGNTMIADNGTHTVMDITPDKKVVWKYDVPGGANMRMVRRLPNGNTLICASSSHVVLEVNPQKEIVWKYKLPFPYLAERLENGDTLISSGDGAGQRGYYLIQVDKEGNTVWQYGGKNAPKEEQLNWPSGFSRQADGTIYVSECLSALIRVISPDRKTFRIIKSPAMEHAATIVVVDEEPERSSGESEDKTPTVHEFDLTAKAFSAQPDGRPKEVWGYNGQFPGPEIRVKEGDLIRVTVNNQLPVPTSIHWHGMKQRDTWRMDGVTPVSRPPIKSGDSFTYEFKAEPAGTHWYHSHTGLQYSEGLHGPLIIESKTNDYDYDRDEVLMIGDWFVEKSDDIYGKIKSGAYVKAEKAGKGPPKPDYGDVPFEAFVFNGKGQLPDGSKGEFNTFLVEKGETVRFRIINTSSTYALKVQFDQHPMTIIESDGQPVKPVKADGITIDIGERFDVLVEANRSGSYHIRAATMDGQTGLALMQYKDSPVSEPAEDADWGSTISGASLVAPQPVDLPAAGHRTVELNFSGSMKPYAWRINGKEFPEGPPVQVREGESIRFVMKNPTMMAHPFHLHGHYFRVLGRRGALNLKNPPLKDSVTVPAKDEMVIQFDADNPGKWFFHCHIEWHLGIGMALVVEYPDL